ncbi:MAG TPA: Hsp20/alpha crystallin family protein [Thermodesulfobacteriota bacterium]
MDVPERRELPINAFETDEELVVVAPMPGIEPEDITVRVEGDTLTMESDARGEDADKRYLHHEWTYGPYHRSVKLPSPVDGRTANVTFGNGVLTIVLPRSQAFVPATLDVPRTGLARGMREGHSGD